ncbi:MAG TPA: hypothetical protein VMU85_15320 [Stellaceae bacterium]|nr:hypothetical protein [Stellaceae bacterium]
MGACSRFPAERRAARSPRWIALLLLLLSLLPASAGASPADEHPFVTRPIWIYDNWSAYDELSDAVPLTEDLAMRELAEIVRLRKLGVEFDYYLMDAFWYAPDGGYRDWRKESWPEGPDRWIEACLANGIKPGLWFGTNSLLQMNAASRWHDSLITNGGAMALYGGGFLPDFMDTLQGWYDRGVRLFKLDFANFDAAVAGDERHLAPAEIRRRNENALYDALAAFRRRNPDVVLVAFNGFGGDLGSTDAPLPFREPVDLAWLKVFDSLYSGDPRPSDLPQMNFWRSVDLYSDHMVDRFHASGVPLPRLDSIAVMIGNTGTNYRRKLHAWQGSMLLMMARGGWVNTVHGELERLDSDQARWLARAQALYQELKQNGRTRSFGGVPGEGAPYGYVTGNADGAVYTVVNPAESISLVPLGRGATEGRILFRDAGYEPVLEGGAIRLGPEQLALVGTGRYADPAYDLGVQTDVVIPRRIAPLGINFSFDETTGALAAMVMPPVSGDLRVILQQRDLEGMALRTSGGAPPDGVRMGHILTIKAAQGGKPLPVEVRYDRMIWSGLSWAAGEIRHGAMEPGEPIEIRLSSTETDPSARLAGQIFVIEY